MKKITKSRRHFQNKIIWHQYLFVFFTWERSPTLWTARIYMVYTEWAWSMHSQKRLLKGPCTEFKHFQNKIKNIWHQYLFVSFTWERVSYFVDCTNIHVLYKVSRMGKINVQLLKYFQYQPIYKLAVSFATVSITYPLLSVCKPLDHRATARSRR